MHADGKSTLVSVSKWNSGKVNFAYTKHTRLGFIQLPHQLWCKRLTEAF